MNKAAKKRWITALRSGKYKQGKGWLCQESDFGTRWCCLGVLADVELDGDWVRDGREWALSAKIRVRSRKESTWLRPRAKQLGLDANVQDRLMGLNDAGRLSFKEIADWIEVNL